MKMSQPFTPVYLRNWTVWITMIVLAVLILWATGGYAQQPAVARGMDPEKWVQVDTDYYVSRDHQNRGSLVFFWIAVPGTGKVHYRMDCVDRLVTPDFSVLDDGSNQHVKPHMAPIAPGTRLDTIREMVCPK